MSKMNSRRRFHETIQYGSPDHVPYFEEGIRKDVIKAWKKQGLRDISEISQKFPSDQRVEIAPDLYPRPDLKQYPEAECDLKKLSKRLSMNFKKRLPDWEKTKKYLSKQDAVRMIRVHNGFFLTMGAENWKRFEQTLLMIYDNPMLVHRVMEIQAEFNARMTDRILSQVSVDAAVFSEPIGGNNGPILSPKVYRDFVLRSYEPVKEILLKHDVKTIILRTYANARVLIPVLLEWGFNCLWACEVNTQAMDYSELRREFGRDLRFIGGIDLDTLREGKDAIRAEIETKVPALLMDGGYIPLADGRVRSDVPLEHYLYYRELLKSYTQDLE